MTDLHRQPSLSLPITLCILISLFLAVGCRSLSPDEERLILSQLLSNEPSQANEALIDLQMTRDSGFAGPLIDLYWAALIGVYEGAEPEAILSALESISGQSLGEDWNDWVTWYSTADLDPPAGYVAWKGSLLGELSAEFEAFFAPPYADSFRPEEVVWGGVAKDGIPALDQIEQVPIREAGYTPKDAIFAISINGDHRAYPLRVMDWHEMANDVVGGVPISIAYCTLCGSAIAYETDLGDGMTLDFGSSGLLYRSNKLMYDRQTNTLWNQLTGEPVMGPLVGEVEGLDFVPILITTVEQWAELHPDATILPLETGFVRDYTAGAAYGEYFVSEDLRFPVQLVDDRLAAKDQIFTLIHNGVAKAYPIEPLILEPVANDAVGGRNVVLVTSSGDINVYGYSYEIEYITYSAGAEIRAFERGEHEFVAVEERVLIDSQGGRWQIGDSQLTGPNGETLTRLGGTVAYWFGWQAFYPETAVYGLE